MKNNYGFSVNLILLFAKRIAQLKPLHKKLYLVLLLSGHLLLTWLCKDFTWLSAFGGLLTVLGVLLIFHYSLPENEPREYKRRKVGTYQNGNSGLRVVKLQQEDMIVFFEQQEKMALEHANYINEKRKHLASYIIFTVSGTLLWAYAGFLQFLFEVCT